MNIFLKVLKRLIGDELNSLATDLDNKTKGLLTNHKLSADQKKEVTTLHENIILYQKTEDDGDTSAAICELIKTTHKAIKQIRKVHKENNEGLTLPALTKLIEGVSEFYEKLKGLEFNLLNMPYTETPEGMVYYHAALYLGEKILTPALSVYKDVKDKKEACISERLGILNGLIKPEQSFEERKKHALKTLKDLERDNKDIVKTANANNYVSIPLNPVGSFKMFGVKLSLAQLIGVSEGRFEVLFTEAEREINKMKAPKQQEKTKLIETTIFEDKEESSESSESNNACTI